MSWFTVIAFLSKTITIICTFRYCLVGSALTELYITRKLYLKSPVDFRMFCVHFILSMAIVIVPANIQAITQDNEYWCAIQEKFCGENEHIGCEPNSFPYNKDAKDLTVIPMTSALKKFIVDKHNHYRSLVANGKLRNYSSASKMNIIQWDKDLQATAELFAKHATYKHDKCRSTETSERAGQNIGYSRSTSKLTNVTEVFETRMNSWYNEFKIDPSVVKAYYSGSGAGHFTAMMRDETSLIGCSASSFNFMASERKRYQILVVCNYQFTNLRGARTYIPGTPCSGCKRCSETYKGLCEVLENISDQI